MVCQNRKPAKARQCSCQRRKQAPVYCLGNKRERQEARLYIASLRYLPEAILSLLGPAACLLTLFFMTGAI